MAASDIAGELKHNDGVPKGILAIGGGAEPSAAAAAGGPGAQMSADVIGYFGRRCLQPPTIDR
jgi:hypothetical protein